MIEGQGRWVTAVVGVAGQGSITVPGCISATPVEAPIDVEEGLPTEVPLVYYFGQNTPGDNPELYKFLVERLANVLSKRVSIEITCFIWIKNLYVHPP